MQKPNSIKEFVKSIKKGETSVKENTEAILQEAEKANQKNSYFNAIAREQAIRQAKEIDAEIKTGRHKGKLLGLPITVKDCICTKGIESRAGSRILTGYTPLFDATAVENAKKEGAIIIGKTAQDEFGFGTFSTNTGKGFPKPKNPFDEKRCCGGSSGGSAGYTAKTKFAHASIGQSTGGSIACPASFCGVVGLTPTYGLVSRYGLIDYANSLDKIGSLGKTVEDAALLLEAIAGYDVNDSTSLKQEKEEYSKAETGKLKIGIAKELFSGCEKEIQTQCRKAIEATGLETEEISLPLNAEFGIAAYYLVSTTEASTNLAKYCGMRYGFQEKPEGNFNEYFSKIRSEHFGEEAKRRILLGTFARMAGFREAYYLKAMKARTKLINEFKQALEKVDVIANPTMPIIAPEFEEIEELSPMQQYAMDLCTVPANLAGMPHASIPIGEHKEMPVGIMITANHLQEKKMIQAATALEATK